MITDDADWLAAVKEACHKKWHESRSQQPQSLDVLRQQLREVERQIKKLVDQLEADEELGESLIPRIRERQRERSDLQRRIHQLEATEQQLPAPTSDWIRQHLQELHHVLKNSGPAANEALRQLLGGP
ncbi:MAG: hypothetical protein U0872_07080 [Planctomycetaceae bacterium]